MASLSALVALAGRRSVLELADDDVHVVQVAALARLGDLVVREVRQLGLVVHVAKQRALRPILPQDGDAVATAQQLAVLAVLEALLVPECSVTSLQ